MKPLKLQCFWSSGYYDTYNKDWKFGPDFIGITRAPQAPFYYDEGDLPPPMWYSQRCLAQCTCNTTETSSYTLADCYRDQYHAICGKYGSVSWYSHFCDILEILLPLNVHRFVLMEALQVYHEQFEEKSTKKIDRNQK